MSGGCSVLEDGWRGKRKMGLGRCIYEEGKKLFFFLGASSCEEQQPRWTSPSLFYGDRLLEQPAKYDGSELRVT